MAAAIKKLKVAAIKKREAAERKAAEAAEHVVPRDPPHDRPLSRFPAPWARAPRCRARPRARSQRGRPLDAQTSRSLAHFLALFTTPLLTLGKP